ncbi:MAG: dihydrolipoamide acetyltransferase family protein [Chloroflexota bacterium]|nr:dihydrolipoamide acetyltransferase family protein [Chloroflexota bacterium]
MAQEVKLPSLGGDSAEGTLLNWLKQPGDTVSANDIIAEVEADKATIEVPAGVAGTVLELRGAVGDALKVGSTIAIVGAAGDAAAAPPAPAAVKSNGAPVSAPPAPAPAATIAPPAEADEDLPDGVKASPIARKIATERGIDLKLVTGTGPGGRIIKSDVETWVAPVIAPAPAAVAPPAPAPAALVGQTWGTVPTEDVEIIELTRIRNRIAQRMSLSKQQVPHFYVSSEIDTQALLDVRADINKTQPEDEKITVNDMIVKATALALVQFPNLNTHFYGDKMVRHKRINIGIAVAIPNGLINVVAKDADKYSLGTIARSNREMIARAREGKVKPEDVQGSTFTVSNLGAFDVEHFLAIINPPEAGILAVSSARKVPVVLADGTLAVGSRMKVTVSVDHRVSDGAEGAQFMQAFKALIENPKRLLV